VRIIMTQDFMGMDGFQWFAGVVEDREDPQKAGRVRVRCIGLHTDDKAALPTEDLPWAQVMAPTDTPSMAGMGNTPSFLVEGTHVIGFFLDAGTMQQPMILGSIPGMPSEEANPELGFYDPQVVYPKTLNEPDTNRLIRGSIGETHPALIKRRGMKQTEIPLSTKPHLSTGVQPGSGKDARKTYDEPDPKSNTPTIYPFNHVHESECGHIHEIDDTPGGERLLQQHISGSFTEIHPTGDKVVKVVGDCYEIIIKDKSILIEGDLNLTVKGNKNELIQGDYVLEVEGDMYTKIHKNQRTKVGAQGFGSGTKTETTFDEDGQPVTTSISFSKNGGNREEEILGSYAYDISNAVKGRVGTGKGERDSDVTIGGNDKRYVGGEYGLIAIKDLTLTSGAGDVIIEAKKNMSLKTAIGVVGIGAGTNVNIQAVNTMLLRTAFGAMTVEAGTSYDISAKTTYTEDILLTRTSKTGISSLTTSPTMVTTATAAMSFNSARIDLN
jgi:hypothetical protein